MVVHQNVGLLRPCGPVPDGRGRREAREEFQYGNQFVGETTNRKNRVTP